MEEPATPTGDPRPVFMEHRWGQRNACRATVSLSTGAGISATAQIRNVSSSGAFIETTLELPAGTLLALFVLGNESAARVVETTAIVVRSQPDGVGVEWCATPGGSICAALGCATRCVLMAR